MNYWINLHIQKEVDEFFAPFELLPGSQNLCVDEDLEYFKKGLFSSLNVPREVYLSTTGNIQLNFEK